MSYKNKENLRRCAKCGCSPAMDPTIAIFRFPKPGKTNTLRCESWAQYCFPDREWFSQEFQLKLHNEHKVLCNKHFKSTSFSDYPVSSKKLHRFAVPEDINEVESYPDVQHTNYNVTRREPVAGPSGILRNVTNFVEPTPERSALKISNAPGPSMEIGAAEQQVISASKCSDELLITPQTQAGISTTTTLAKKEMTKKEKKLFLKCRKNVKKVWALKQRIKKLKNKEILQPEIWD